MSHMPTIANAQWADATLPTFGAVGDGSTENSTAINAALTAMAGKGIFFPPGTYRFDKMLDIPANTHVELWPGAVLQCRVTGGGHGIRLGNGAKLYSVGGGAGGAQVVAYNGCNVDSLITNTSQDGTQEYFFLSGVFIQANSGATIGTALVNLVSVFVNSGVRDVVINGNSTAPTGLRIAGGTITGFGPVYVEDVWVANCTQHNIVVIENNPANGACTGTWLTNVTSENQGSGYHGLYIQGYGSLASVHVRNYHYEHGTAVAAPTYAIYSVSCPNLVIDGADMLAANLTNKSGIVIAASAYSYQVSVQNIQNPNNINPILNDLNQTRSFAARNIGLYRVGNQGAASGHTDQMMTHLLQLPGGVSTFTKAGVPTDGDFPAAPPDGTLAVDTTDNKIYARIGGVWKGVAVA